MLSFYFLFTDTFHEVRRRRDRKKEVRFPLSPYSPCFFISVGLLLPLKL